MSLPQFTSAIVVRNQTGLDGLEYVEKLPLPQPKADEVVVKIHAASLNFRDLMIAKGGPGLSLGKETIVPGSDGAGVVEAVGSNVTNFAVGDKVCTHLMVGFPSDTMHILPDAAVGLGQGVDGTLRQFGVFSETSLVKMPANLNFLQAATLTCSGLTAWNALFGVEGRGPRAGDTVVVQGTGGVSIAALQIAIAAGATVIATTSSEDKAKRLKDLGAQHVVNYRETPEWGQVVKSLTSDGKGAHIVVDVGGASTLAQSLKAVRVDGLVSATGILGESPDGKMPNVLDLIWAPCMARGVVLGSRDQFVAMNKFIEEHDVKPVVDEKTFDLRSAREAYGFMTEQKHFSKVGIQIA